MRDHKKLMIHQSADIRTAVKTINDNGIGFAVIVDDNEVIIAILTDGDFRRAVLRGLDLNENVLEIANRTFKYVKSSCSHYDALEIMQRGKFGFLPVVDDEGKLVEIVAKNDLIAADVSVSPPVRIESFAVIMAGGKGTRMAPFTEVLPKPLIPIGDKTMIEIVMDEYAKFGIDIFYISVGHKAKMIKSYFEYCENSYQINYINEDKPLGTCGALKYLEGKFTSPFFVSNCDIIIKNDYAKIYKYHQAEGYILTIVTSMQHVIVPYGVCELKDNGSLLRIKEKPKFDYLINTGMYVLSPEALQFIPSDCYFDITDLIEALLANNLKVGVYPVSEQSYIDVGQWNEYKKAINILTI